MDGAAIGTGHPAARWFGPPARWAALAAGAAGLVYGGVLQCGFVVDDLHQIVDNDWVTSVGHLPEVFSSGVWDFEGRTSNYYRPLMFAWYMVIHALAGKAPWAYHLANLLLHVAATALVTVVAARLLGQGVAARGLLPGPLVAGLLFALHPIHTEPVTWVAGAPDLGATVFALAALWMWITASDAAWGRVAGAAACVLVSALFKEPGVAIVGVLAAYDLLVRPETIARHRLVLRYAMLGATLLVYLALRVHALGSLAPAAVTPVGTSTWLGSVVVLGARYLQALVAPVGLSFWHAFVPPSSLLEPRVLLSLLIVVITIVAATVAGRASRQAALASVLLALPLLPAFHLGGLSQGLEYAFAERYLYLPSAGFVLLVAIAYQAIAARHGAAGLAAGVVVAVTASLYAAGTALRVPAWRDHVTLWSDAVAKAPGSATARMNYGFALLAVGRTAEGHAALRSAVSQQPELVNRHMVRAAAYMARGLTRKAIFAFHAALALNPNLPDAHFGLGVAYDALAWTDAAMTEYETAIGLAPGHADAHNNLGVLRAQRGDMAGALPLFEAAVRLRPTDASFRANLERARRPR